MADFSQLILFWLDWIFICNKYFWREKCFPKQNKTKTNWTDEGRTQWGNVYSPGRVTSHSESSCKCEIQWISLTRVSSCLKVSVAACLDRVPVLITSLFFADIRRAAHKAYIKLSPCCPVGKREEESTLFWSHLLYRQLHSSVRASSLWALLKKRGGCGKQNVLIFIHVLIWGVAEKTNSWDCCHCVPGVRAKWC